MKKNSCKPINPKKYSCYGLKKIHTRNLITKKNSCGSKIPHPPHNFSNGPSLKRLLDVYYIILMVVLQENLLIRSEAGSRNSEKSIHYPTSATVCDSFVLPGDKLLKGQLTVEFKVPTIHITCSAVKELHILKHRQRLLRTTPRYNYKLYAAIILFKTRFLF